MPSITVFMPVYNALPHLPEAVESIRRQTLEDWVFLIVDDGSTDGSAEYLDRLNDPRIRILHQAHQGPAAASNLALSMCETELIARMDADDVAYPDRLAEQVAFLKTHPEVGLVGSQIAPLGSKWKGRPSSLATHHAAIFDDLIHGRHAMCNPTIACRTALLREVGGYLADGPLEDWAMFLAMGEKAELANLDRPLLSYRIHGGSTNGRHMAELRARIAFACQRATERRAGQTETTYEQFMAARRAASTWRRAQWWLEGHAMGQYRRAMADILGSHRLLGYARLAWAAACSPRLTIDRIARIVRKVASPGRSTERIAGGDSAGDRVTVGGDSVGDRITVGGDSVGDRTGEDRQSPAASPAQLRWPKKYDLFGVQTSATNYAEACDAVIQAARQQTPAIVSLHAVHAIVSASNDPELREAVNTFQIVATDGQPVRWAMNLLHKTGLRDRVYGPELMLRLCRRAAEDGVSVYLYGASPETLDLLQANLTAKFPSLVIAGAESPPFRAISEEEENEAIARINDSGAGNCLHRARMSEAGPFRVSASSSDSRCAGLCGRGVRFPCRQ